ncbi:MAG TPA: SDR family NAD(P)-dependent oxidoreductase, partial [Duganella sp.]|nr:SDR family NAD(P)-dependent oxidoreductase [Duganella sp.]
DLARDTDSLAPLVARYGSQVLPLRLDVTDRVAAQQAVQAAHAHFGRLDVVVNNAGYGLFGMTEEVSEQQARQQFETNFFGALWVTQAALPLLRAQQSGHIVQVSSIGGLTAFPQLGLYNASKWALEGFSQALAAEVGSFGVHVTLVEPAGYATDWSAGSATHAQPLAAYEGVRAYIREMWSGHTPGDPQATGAALLALVDAEHPPLRAFLGKGMLDMVRAEYTQRLQTWDDWSDVAEAAMGAV